MRSFARRKPGTYLALALGAGVLAGRLTRGLTAPTDDTTTGRPATGTATPGTSTYQVGTGRPALTGADLPGSPSGYDPAPVIDPLLPVPPPVAGLGTTGCARRPAG